MTTNVPPVTFGANGFQAPSTAAVLEGVQLDINAAFGGTLNYQLTTPQGQLASSEAALIVNTNAIFVYYTNQVDPAYASGRMQDAIGRIYFIERIGAQPTVIQVTCNGLPGVNIPLNALIQDAAGNIYACTQAGVIPPSGNIVLPFANQISGPIAVPDTITIYQAIPGWDSVSVSSGVLGNATESRAAFEARRAATVAGNSFGAIGSILGAVSKVSGIEDFWGYDNSTAIPVTVQGVLIAPNSIYITAVGGTDIAVAQAILSKKGPGCAYNGNTTVTAYDSNPLYSAPIPYSVTFERPAPLQILFAVNIVNSSFVPSDATTQIQNAIINAFAGGDGGARARVGSTILATRFVAPVAALGAWAQIKSLLIASANNPAAVFSGTIAGTTLTVALLISGTIAIGQTITDTNGDIILGTTIISGSGSSWVVSNSQTVAGASFTGNGSGVNLTASAVTGTIEIGNVIAGTGVPAGTTIISQTSGTPGGAGVYVTSVATTASSASLTAKKNISAAVANQNSVAVNGNQVPEVVAANILVSFS